jgi:tyrosine-protein phosphatase YwqE
MFRSLFKPKQLKQAVDLGMMPTDVHSHLIPGIDDGAKDLDESIFLIRRMYDMGFRHFITTPHIMNEFYKNTPEIILSGLEKLREAVKAAGIPVTINAAAEYLIDIDFENKFRSDKLMTFGDNYLLVELSYFNYPQNLFSLFFDLQIEGYKIILAHPERYTYWHTNQKAYFDLKDRNIFFQLNTISLAGYYQGQTREIAIKLIDNGLIEFIGSDMHNASYLHGLDKSQYEPALLKLLESGKLMNGIFR